MYIFAHLFLISFVEKFTYIEYVHHINMVRVSNFNNIIMEWKHIYNTNILPLWLIFVYKEMRCLISQRD